MIRIITIDGPSGTGKGTIAKLLAARLGNWWVLDSGALYRALGLVVLRHNLGPLITELTPQLIKLASDLEVKFKADKVFLAAEDVTAAIRAEATGEMASRIATEPKIRAALLAKQQSYAKHPGLIADGRDMGTVVFPEAQIKIFLTASPEERAKRRYKQLKEKDLDANISDIAAALRERDERDRTRSVAPLKAAAAALELDSTGRSIEDVLDLVLAKVRMTFTDLHV